jgi:menaquinone-9 beta-reductase
MKRYDAIVVGAGPAGSATAALLAATGRTVLVLDAARFPRRKACAEYISPGGADILHERGALNGEGRWLRGMAIRAPSGAEHVVEYCGGARRGLSISREKLDLALLEVACARGAELRQGCRVMNVVHDEGRVSGVRLVDGQEIRARTVVGADGLHSVVARAAGKPLPVRWPRRLGLVAHLEEVEWPDEVGQMWVGRGGYVGVAPLNNDGLVTVGLVRSMRHGHATASELFEKGLAEFPGLARRLSVGQRVGTVIGVGPLARRVRRCAGPGYLLVGDAAGFFDPFTGEGIFRALRSAQLAMEYINDPHGYSRARKAAFQAKERLTQIIQIFVQAPPLLELAVRRLNQRPAVAAELGNMLGDLESAHLGVVWRLLGP